MVTGFVIFNPCFVGWCLESSCGLPFTKGHKMFNPYSVGWCLERVQHQYCGQLLRSFNPCFAGWCLESKPKASINSFFMWFQSLFYWAVNRKGFFVISGYWVYLGFNPCFIGWRIESSRCFGGIYR